jgi:hypothetical protein
MTTCIIDNAALLEQLNQFTEPTELRDESGRVLGYYHPLNVSASPTERSVQSPFSREEIEQRRQQRTGRPLAEILERLSES